MDSDLRNCLPTLVWDSGFRKGIQRIYYCYKQRVRHYYFKEGSFYFRFSSQTVIQKAKEVFEAYKPYIENKYERMEDNIFLRLIHKIYNNEDK